ncbi:hypothetical protein Dimus_034865 [Dionaea muscipula]
MQGFNVYTPSAKFLPKSFALLNHRPYNLPWWDQILDPRSEFVTKWNNFFVVACLVTLFLDPLYFFVPYMCGTACLCSNLAISVTVTFFRTVTDCFYLLHILFKFRTSFVAPNSRVYGRRELVTDPTSIALRYLKTDFIIDLAAMLPLPQIVVWFVVPALKSTSFHTNHTLSLIVLIQYVPRMFVMFPLNQKIVNSTGVVARTAWSGAAYNVLLLILASHVLGAIWYIWSIQRLHTCWMIECKNDWNVTHFPCDPSFFESKSLDLPARKVWLNGTHVLASCDPREDVNFKFGLFADALVDDVPSAGFFEAYFYCLWWGLKSLRLNENGAGRGCSHCTQTYLQRGHPRKSGSLNPNFTTEAKPIVGVSVEDNLGEVNAKRMNRGQLQISDIAMLARVVSSREAKSDMKHMVPDLGVVEN